MPASNMAEYIRLRYHRRRRKAIKHLGSKCKQCGALSALELDHIDSKQKSFSIARLWSVSEARFWAEIEKCQLLCRACHALKSIAERGLKTARGNHGTVSSYRYCKCDACKKAQADYNRAYRQRHVTPNGAVPDF